MDCRLVAFCAIEIDGVVYEHDVVISSSGEVRRRKKGPSKPRRPEFGHTPLTPEEQLPWSAAILIVGTGASGRLPVTDELYEVAAKRGVAVVARPTAEACALLSAADPGTAAAVLHVTC
jgi:hypothetical protein